MAKRAKDILINIGSGDFTLAQDGRKTLNYHEIIWGALFPDDDNETLYANIYIPPYELDNIKPEDGRIKVYFHTDYKPVSDLLYIRFVTKSEPNYDYAKIDQSEYDFPVESLALFPSSNRELYASELFSINSDGDYVAELVFGEIENRAYIYSAGNVDFEIGISDEQTAQLLSLCAPGKYYRYPLSGVDITKYVNTVIGNTDFSERINEEFRRDNIDAQSVDFDSLTGAINVQFMHEQSDGDGSAVIDVSNLDTNVIDVTDTLLADVSANISLEELDFDYDSIAMDADTPEELLDSCFGNGNWIGLYPWTWQHYWKNHK